MLLSTGKTVHVPWGGFIQRRKVVCRSRIRPIKLAITVISEHLLPEQSHSGYLGKGEYIQGALIDGKAFAVLAQSVRVVQGPEVQAGD